MPRFTILIAAYNAEPYLGDCLRSLERQTEGSFQAICIDDCSTDGTAALLAQQAARDARFSVVRTPSNSGQAIARNLGLRQAEGDFTLILDADDTLAETALADLWATHEAWPLADAIVMNLVKTWPDGRTETVPLPDEEWPVSGRRACLLSVDWRLHGLYALRTDLFRQQPYDETLRAYGDDISTCFHYLSARTVARSAATYFYRQHDASCTHAVDLRRLDFLDAHRLLRTRLEAAGVSRECLCRCERYCWYNYVGVYRQMRALRADLTAAQWQDARRRLAACLRAMRPSRLPLSAWRQPSTVFVRPFRLFCLWQALLIRLSALRR